MLDISCVGYVSVGENSIVAAKRELKEELNIKIEEKELEYIATTESSKKHSPIFINNEFQDIYLIEGNFNLSDITYQKEEISEIFYLPYTTFKEMVANQDKELISHEEEYNILISLLDKKLRENKAVLEEQ